VSGLSFTERCRVLHDALVNCDVEPENVALIANFEAGCAALHDRLVRDVKAKRLVLAKGKLVAIVAEPSDRLVLAWRPMDRRAPVHAMSDAMLRARGGSKLPINTLATLPPWLVALVDGDMETLAARVTAWNFARVTTDPSTCGRRSPANLALRVRDMALEELVAVVLHGADPTKPIALPVDEPAAPAPVHLAPVQQDARPAAPALPSWLTADVWIDFEAVDEPPVTGAADDAPELRPVLRLDDADDEEAAAPGVAAEDKSDDDAKQGNAAHGQGGNRRATAAAQGGQRAPDRGGEAGRTGAADGTRGQTRQEAAPRASGGDRQGHAEGRAPSCGVLQGQPDRSRVFGSRSFGEAVRPQHVQVHAPDAHRTAPPARAHQPPEAGPVAPPARRGRKPDVGGPTLPLRPLVDAIRSAHPGIVGLDDVTAADVASLTASLRRALEARYLATPGRVATFAEAAARVGLSRAAVHLSEKQAFQALELSGATPGQRGRTRTMRPTIEHEAVADDGLAPAPAPPRKRKPRAPTAKTSADAPAPRVKVTHRSIAGEQEAALILAYQRGDQRAGAMLLEAHAGAIALYALRWRGRGLEDEDLLQEGRIGFLRGVEKFDSSHGVKLVTYAVYWIKQNVRRSVEDLGTTVRVPCHVHQKLGLARKQGLRTPEAIDEAGILSTDRASGALAALTRPISTEDPFYEDDGDTVGDRLESGEAGPEEDYDAAERIEQTRERVASLLAVLDERERYVIERRIAAPDGDEQILQDIGDHFGLSRERIRQLEVRAMRKMRTAAVQQRMIAPAAMPELIDQALLVARENADATDDDSGPNEPWLPTRLPRASHVEPLTTALPMSSTGTRIDAFVY
jgi:RNA polymerase sigma factor (sigma-70 family)